MVKYMKKYRIYVFLLLFAGWLDVAGQKQVCEAAVLSEKTAVIMAASQVQEKDQGQDTAEELQTGAEDFLNIKAFHLQEVEESLADLEEESSFRFADALKSLIRGEIPLNLSTLKTLVFDALLLEWKNQKETALQVFLLVIVAALVLNFTDLMEKNGTALISFFMMYLMLAAVLMKGFTGMSRMTDATLGRVNGFMKALVPSYFAAAVFAVKFYVVHIEVLTGYGTVNADLTGSILTYFKHIGCVSHPFVPFIWCDCNRFSACCQCGGMCSRIISAGCIDGCLVSTRHQSFYCLRTFVSFRYTCVLLAAHLIHGGLVVCHRSTLK